MRPVLIMAYYYPPGNFAGSYRVKAWIDHLYKFGYYPIVLTRFWEENETDYTAISSEKEIIVKDFKTHKIIQLNYKGTFRDKLVKRYNNRQIQVLAKFFSFFQLIAQNVRLKSSPASNFYFFAKHYLTQNPDIKLVIASGKPFILFKFCYHLKKKIPRVQWIADYRDPWNTDIHISRSIKRKFFSFIERPFERKWVSTADRVLSVSDTIANDICLNIGADLKYNIIHNGFEEYTLENKLYEDLTISYIGSLYNEQKIEVFLEGLKFFLQNTSDAIVKINFLGLASQKDQMQRVVKAMEGFSDFVTFYPKQKKEKMMLEASKSHLLLICGMPERKGTYTAKLMDYLSLKIPILLVPSDKDVIEKTLQSTGAGLSLSTSEEIYSFLKESYDKWKHGLKVFDIKENVDEIKVFSNVYQTKKLADILNEILTA